MTDIHTTKVRSYNMSKIRSKNTKPEIVVRKLLFAKGYRFRIHDKKLPSNPDIVLKKYNTVIFVHGCFWHMHESCKFSSVPASNMEYWVPKLTKNAMNDEAAVEILRNLNWKVIVLWECQLRSKVREDTLNNLIEDLKNNL